MLSAGQRRGRLVAGVQQSRGPAALPTAHPSGSCTDRQERVTVGVQVYTGRRCGGDGVCGARLELKKLDPHFSPSKHRTKPRGTKREVCATRGDAWQRVSVRCVKHRRRPCFKAHVKIWKETMLMRNIGTSMYIFRLVACRAGFMCGSRAKMKWYADCRIEQLNAYVRSVAEEKKACLYKESAKRADIVLKKTLTTMDKNAKDAR